jgi:ABC-2 type transport system ATP-binding protein
LSTPAITLRGLQKTFGRGREQVQALRGIDLEVQPGQVFGFLGPNGAGKSTTIRILMGLLRASSGEAFLFGEQAGDRAGPRPRVGALIEGAAFYPFLTGRQNLEVLAQTANQDRQRIEPLLAQLELTKRADQKVSNYSTGMKQRLGLAAALLQDPELIILDEPTNGLDPAGISQMRKFIRSLVTDEGKTVFLSSHILHEVEQICDRVAIIYQGRLVREGSVKSLLSEGLAQLRLQATPLARAEKVLSERWPVSRQGDWLLVQTSPEQAPSLVKALTMASVELYQLVSQTNTLESYFLDVTRQEAADEPAQG